MVKNTIAGYRMGSPVKVAQPSTFKGYKLGLVSNSNPCKDGGVPVYLSDPTTPIKNICIHVDRGDIIVKISLKESINK
jgi:hypothetical protein